MAIRARRMERTLDELVAEAREDEQAKVLRQRRAAVIAEITAGVSGFREPGFLNGEEDTIDE